MRPIYRFCFALLLLPLCTGAAAQDMYKCKDAAGKITYSGKGCSLIGLTSAGEVTGKASVAPAVKASPSRPAAPAARPPTPPAASQSAAKEPEPAEPERRCFQVKAAKGKGTVTRCNDKPPEEPESK